MPLDSTPRSFAFLISRFISPASAAASRRSSAHGTFCPAATLGAPQTMLQQSRPCPRRLRVTRSLSAFGCGATLFTWPTTMPENSPATGVISSTSRPPMVSALRELVDRHVADRDQLAQPLHRDLHRNCSRNLRSFSKKRRRSFTPYLSIARRSRPMPNAKPEYFSGSMPPLRSTSGCTTPAPAISR